MPAPAASFSLLVHSGVVSAASFALTSNGRSDIVPGSTSLLALDMFHGLKRISAIVPL